MVNPSDIVLEEEDDPEEVLQRADRVKGIGFDKQHILSMSSKAIAQQVQTENEKDAPVDEKIGTVAMNKMSAVNVQDLKYLD